MLGPGRTLFLPNPLLCCVSIIRYTTKHLRTLRGSSEIVRVISPDFLETAGSLTNSPLKQGYSTFSQCISWSWYPGSTGEAFAPLSSRYETPFLSILRSCVLL